SSRRRHTRFSRDWSSDVCSSDLDRALERAARVEDLVLERRRNDPGAVVRKHLAGLERTGREQVEVVTHRIAAGIGVEDVCIAAGLAGGGRVVAPGAYVVFEYVGEVLRELHPVADRGGVDLR